MQTVQPQGPYLLGGHSFGALVAFEMSQQLQRHEVALLVIFDMIAPNLFNKLKNFKSSFVVGDLSPQWLKPLLQTVAKATTTNKPTCL